MTLRLLPAAAFRRMPWKNGGGETIEIAASPDGAGLDGFDWRVSMARVAADGPFSIFPGIDRTLAVLDGGGLVLRLPDGTVTLTPASAPVSFAADVAVAAALTAGPIVDFNVMSRRGRIAHELRRLPVAAPLAVSCAGAAALLFAHGGGVGIAADGAGFTLAAGDAALVTAGGGIDVTASPRDGAPVLYVATFRPQ